MDLFPTLIRQEGRPATALFVVYTLALAITIRHWGRPGYRWKLLLLWIAVIANTIAIIQFALSR